MSQTVIRGTQILNNTVQRQDLDTSTVGQAVVTKLVQGSGITLSSTGADSGTGDVTVSSPDVVSTDAGNIATLGTDNHILVPQSQIWSVRLRSFNAVGNPTFEVDQRSVGGSVTAGANIWGLDRWQLQKNAGTTMAATGVQSDVSLAPITIPGTNFTLTSKFYHVTLTGTQASLGASDIIWLNQSIEGACLRALRLDVHSVSILVKSTVASLNFGLALRDAAAAFSLTKLCTTSATPGTWTLISLPNLPVWTPSATWSLSPGIVGYQLSITLAAGSTYTSPSNGSWVSGNFVGALGQDNFASKALNSTFDIAFVQHEPGALCTTPQDCSFGQNLDGDFGCLRYFCKSYDYKTAIGSVTDNGTFYFWQARAVSQTFYLGLVPFPKRMAKVPAVAIYNPVTGAFNSISSSRGNIAVTSVTGLGESGFSDINVAAFTGPDYAYGHYIADTGW